MDLESLRAVSILRDLTDAELEAFGKLLGYREARNGEKLVEEGTSVHHLFIVCDGVVHVRRMAQKREVLMGRLGVGAFFGEINLFDPGVATASIYAMKGPTRLAVVDYESLRAFMAANPATGYKIVSAMMTETARRLRQTNARLINTIYWSSPEAKSDLKQ
jgi:CRP/FNR family cyclic AMP-dependent transcriptional regulator